MLLLHDIVHMKKQNKRYVVVVKFLCTTDFQWKVEAPNTGIDVREASCVENLKFQAQNIV